MTDAVIFTPQGPIKKTFSPDVEMVFNITERAGKRFAMIIPDPDEAIKEVVFKLPDQTLRRQSVRPFSAYGDHAATGDIPAGKYIHRNEIINDAELKTGEHQFHVTVKFNDGKTEGWPLLVKVVGLVTASPPDTESDPVTVIVPNTYGLEIPVSYHPTQFGIDFKEMPNFLDELKTLYEKYENDV